MADWEYRCYRIFGIKSFSLDHWNPDLFLKSQWSNTCYGCDFFYLIYRFVVAVFWIGVLVSSAISDVPWLDPSAGGAMWFLFLSNWSLVILTMNTSLEAFNTLLNRFRRNKSSDKPTSITALLKIQWVLHNIALCSGIMSTLVDAIYIRSVIHNPDSRGIFVYIVNTIYLMFNFFIVGTPLRFFHFLHTTIFIFIFVIISTLKQYFNGVMVYSFINWRSPLSAGLYTSLGVLFGVMAIWSLLVLLYLLRLKLAGESFDDEGKVKEVTPYDPFRESRA